MKYPIIKNINDVLPYIMGNENFIIKDYDYPNYDMGGYISINYRTYGEPSAIFEMDKPEISAILRECRGIKFDRETGNLLARPFHKFFNYNEVEETKNLNFTNEHLVLSKADGSMIHPIFDNLYGIYFCTKAGITEIAIETIEWLKSQEREIYRGYVDFMNSCEENNYTPIFEFCSLFNRVVLPYEKTRLILLAIRHKETGEYLNYSKLKDISNVFNLDLIEQFPAFSPEAIEDLKTKENIEGVVIHFDDKFVKLKSEWYCLLHRGKETICHEKNVLRIILEEGLDDLLPILQEADRKFIERYANSINESFKKCENIISNSLIFTKSMFTTRKEVALHIINAYKKNDVEYLLPIFWKCYDEKETSLDTISIHLKEQLLRKCQSQKSVDSIRNFIGLHYDRRFLKEE